MEVLSLSTSVQESRNKYEAVLFDLEIQRVANSAIVLQNVPTLPNDVKFALRSRGLPVRLFGENLMNIRDRLRYEIAKEYVLKDNAVSSTTTTTITPKVQFDIDNLDGQQYRNEHFDNANDEEVTKYTRATQALIDARHKFTQYSLLHAKERLHRERIFRYVSANANIVSSQQKQNHNDNEHDNDNDNSTIQLSTSKKRSLLSSYSNELQSINEQCFFTYKSLRQITLEGTQYGDSRALSCISVCYRNSTRNGTLLNNSTIGTTTTTTGTIPLVVTASWTGSIQLWDGTSAALNQLAYKTNAHTDRIMGIATTEIDNSTISTTGGNSSNSNNTNNNSAWIATTSIDMTAKLWKVENISTQQKQEHTNDDNETMNDTNDQQQLPVEADDDNSVSEWTINEVGHYKGHKARLCRVAFHPMKQHIATTSFDNTWRLWDINRPSDDAEVLLQDGHCSQVYGIAFHPDGSLCSTTDYSGVIQLWDLRTSKSIRHFVGHARRTLNVEFHPINGYQLASAGDDGTIRIWDLRKRKQLVSIPAHSNLITNLRFEPSTCNGNGSGGGGEFLVSSSFDGTIRIWNTRNWKLLNTLRGHNDGKVSGVDIINSNTLVSCGLDKTLKMWK